ncbi:carbonic anhydrase [Yersinia entomophaga]|uniref:Carbonic anhydrase n=1 Tax=Yersinia entomophaga TaxID=935293 RepID=A0ABN4PSS5_YERET|nr:carbonic anhydrase [Yersinia entomophaga]ANI28791.1 carbonic anhydrase [Yersinia entomophaga]OWF89679.1 carbonic anhydrase [Yersinia entomophaga]
MESLPTRDPENGPPNKRRSLLKAAIGMSALSITGAIGLTSPGVTYAAALTKEERDKLTPDQIIQGLKDGNIRFRHGKMQQHDYLAQKRASASGQFPSAVILSCIDSRAPAEIVFDTGIGETFNGRIAGNIANNDLLGSLEFACAVAGAKVILVLGHTACGAIRGAIDNVELGNLTGLLAQIKPAIAATEYSGDRSGNNAAFVDAVAKTNVENTIKTIRERSDILNKLEKEGKIKIIGAMYQLDGGAVDFIQI